MNHNIEIEIPEPLSEMVLTRAAEDEVPVEELIGRMLKNYLKPAKKNQ